MFYLKELFQTLIFYILAIDFQQILAITLFFDIRQQSVCYLTTIIELTMTIEEFFTFAIILDRTSLLNITKSTLSITMLLVFIFSASSFSISLVSSSISFRYIFNSQLTENITVYFNQTTTTGDTTFTKQYIDQNIDIVILVFVISQNDFNSLYSKINFETVYSDQILFIKKEAFELLFCSELTADIDICQTIYSKKVFLNIDNSRQSIIFNTVSDVLVFRNIL
jgi:hypothetical protein